MKQLILSILIIFISASGAFAMPDNLYDKNVPNEPILYDVSYNIALRKKLEDDFHKKYTVKVDETHYIDTSPMGAYSREVLVPYDLNKKPDDYKIISK